MSPLGFSCELENSITLRQASPLPLPARCWLSSVNLYPKAKLSLDKIDCRLRRLYNANRRSTPILNKFDLIFGKRAAGRLHFHQSRVPTTATKVNPEEQIYRYVEQFHGYADTT